MLPDWEDGRLQDKNHKKFVELDDETDDDFSCLIVEKQSGNFCESCFSTTSV